MLQVLQRLEERLVRLEAGVLVALVLLMLLLAVYNVFYRNVLVPVQVAVTTVVVPVDAAASEEQEVPTGEEPGEQEEPEAEGFGGGFGGGFGDEEEPEEPEAEGFGGGFGGGFGDEEEPEGPEAEGFGGGFGGGFGDEETEAVDQDEALLEADGEAAVVEEPTEVVVIRKPEEGSFEAVVDALIDAVKLDWIDILLRQLVLIVGFLGAMLATQRRKHITIDALSKILPDRALGWVHVATNLLAVAICTLLAVAGWDLVQIGRAFPRELVHWADEWTFQLAFPIGFGMLTLHFVVRLLESIEAGRRGVEPEQVALGAEAPEPDDEPTTPTPAGVAGAEGGGA